MMMALTSLVVGGAVARTHAQTTQTDETSDARRYATGEGDPNDESLPGVIVIPMKGQAGTDIHEAVYNEELVEVIKAADPALIIWELESADRDDLFISMSDRREASVVDLEQYRRIIDTLKEDLRDVPQVMWVQDAVGISAVFALAWSDMYMASDARLFGLSQLYLNAAGWSDPDVRAKMVAAWVGIGNGFLERGGYPIELGRAMMNPNHLLSATWVGREVDWSLDAGGEYLFDGSDEVTASFTAKTAEDFRISDGTADTLDDLMLLLGYREYRVLESEAPKMVEDYIEDWRRAFDQCKVLAQDYEQHTSWATGDETVKWLGRARRDLERILSAMKRYPAIELRAQRDLGMNMLQIELEIERIKERIRQMNDRGRGGFGGRGGGGGRAGGGG